MDLDYKEIGRNIRRYRKSCKLKQKDLAEKVNLTEQHISHIETGCRNNVNKFTRKTDEPRTGKADKSYGYKKITFLC